MVSTGIEDDMVRNDGSDEIDFLLQTAAHVLCKSSDPKAFLNWIAMAAQPVAATDKRGPGTQTALVSGGRKKIHTTYQNGEEQVEEFDLTTDELLEQHIISLNDYS